MSRIVPLRRWAALQYQPNRWALDHVHSSESRFNAFTLCRQSGKTFTAAAEIDLALIEKPDFFGPPWVGVLAPTYDKAELVVDRYMTMVQRAFGKNYIKVNKNKHEGVIELPNNQVARLKWMSAQDPENVVGPTFSKLIVDEAQFVPDIVIAKVLPTLDVRNGPVFAFGTPDITPDQSWFKGMWLRGQNPEDHDYNSFTLSWRMNPWMSEESVEQARELMSAREFRMLYEGEWVDEEGTVFHNIDAAILDHTPEYSPSRSYIMSVDLAVYQDYNVVLVAELGTRTIVHLERWNWTDPLNTYDRIGEIWERFGNPTIIADQSGMGEGMVPELRRRFKKVRGVKFTAANKMPMVSRLASDIEHRRIMFPPLPQLLTELRGYVFKETPSGKLTAEAAAGVNDDCVASMLLLNEGFRMVRAGTTRPAKDTYVPRASSTPISDILNKLPARA